ncbi:unnamed protein product [Rotaria sp. Silwood1]|nr:unnamed protein product [Rotaria sp. Silwood1]
MSFEEIDTEDSASSLSEVSSLDDEFDTMHLDFDSSEEVTDYDDDDDDMDLHTWNEIEPESDAEFLEDHGLIEDMYKLAATNGYVWNYVIYTGEQDLTAGIGHAQTIVMKLLDGLDGCYRTVVADNFFTSISLAKYLLEHDTYLIGTLRSNRVGSGSKVLEENISRGEVYGLQNKDGIKLIRWKYKNDVLMVSTKPAHSTSVIDSGKTNFQNERIMKPQVVLDYNEGRQGTDLSD